MQHTQTKYRNICVIFYTPRKQFYSLFSRSVFYTCMQQIFVSKRCCQIWRTLMNMYISWFTITTYSKYKDWCKDRVYYDPVSRSIDLLWESVSCFLAVCIFSFLKDSIDFQSFVPRATKHPLNGVSVWHSQLALSYTHHIIITNTSENDLI